MNNDKFPPEPITQNERFRIEAIAHNERFRDQLFQDGIRETGKELNKCFYKYFVFYKTWMDLKGYPEIDTSFDLLSEKERLYHQFTAYFERSEALRYGAILFRGEGDNDQADRCEELSEFLLKKVTLIGKRIKTILMKEVVEMKNAGIGS